MQSWFRHYGNWIQALILGVVLAGLAGCATSEPENTSERPWNSPKGWETGVPTGLYEGR